MAFAHNVEANLFCVVASTAHSMDAPIIQDASLP